MTIQSELSAELFQELFLNEELYLIKKDGDQRIENKEFEAKITDKDSTKLEAKKIMLLNNLNLSTSYNFNADGKT